MYRGRVAGTEVRQCQDHDHFQAATIGTIVGMGWVWEVQDKAWLHDFFVGCEAVKDYFL